MGRSSGPVPFASIRAAALQRHGAAALEAQLPSPRSTEELLALPDDRYLSAMSLRTFRAGLKHELVDRRWPAFEEVFSGFVPARCAALYDEELEAMLADRRLIRHAPKLRAVRENAAVMLEIEAEHGSFGRWIAAWPVNEIVRLWEVLAKRFRQLGGNSAPSFLRIVGKDTFLPTTSVVQALHHWEGSLVDPGTREGRAILQRVFNRWADEARLPHCQLSQILALSAD